MRLAKFLALSGVASRRKSEELVFSGRVTLNGATVKLPQQEVTAKDVVAVDGKRVHLKEQKYYCLLNKPAGYISTVTDPQKRPTVIDLIKKAPDRLYPVGRLDYDTRGLLLLTNDGQLAHRLTHPSFGVKKVYRALVKGLPEDEALQKLRGGVEIDGKKTSPAKVKLIRSDQELNRSVLLITLAEGKKRQVKLICAAVGHPVLALTRVEFAGLTLDEIPEGGYRHLNQAEVEKLYSLAGINKGNPGEGANRR